MTDSPKKTLKLGTRRSLLAWAQSSGIAREVERKNPNVTVELVGIETRGDKILDVPLQKVEGKDFFVAELDTALFEGRVDFNVHSYKDLSTQRPAGIALAAVPPRENPRDIVIFSPDILLKLRDLKTVRIGTSSPRRLENVPHFLEKALPRISDPSASPKMEWVEIRGNINSRLARLKDSNPERELDGVVLALAGLIRLYEDEAIGRKELLELLNGCRWMVLPLDYCPAAPAQGALAIECREKDRATLEVLRRLHDPVTARAVETERRVLEMFGGGCHQRFGVTLRSTPGMGDILVIKGKSPTDDILDEIRWDLPPTDPSLKVEDAWDGGFWRRDQEKSIPFKNFQSLAASPDLNGRLVFVAHSRAVTPEWEKILKNQSPRVFCSGVDSWVKLANKGIWVECCGEGFGFDDLLHTINHPFFTANDPGLSWCVFTHLNAQESWPEHYKVFPTYEITPAYSSEAIEALKKARIVYWTSGSQYGLLKNFVQKNAKHCCGPGKTRMVLQREGIVPMVFPTAKEWRKWIGMV